MNSLKTAGYRLYAARSGAVFPLFAVSIMALILSVGLAVDVGRIYAVRVKMQQASDAALLGAAATASQTPVNTEYGRLFNANFPSGYMSSTQVGLSASCNAAASLCNATATFSLPMTLMVLANAASRQLTVTSQVSRGFSNSPNKLELSLVMDNSARMGTGGLSAERTAGVNMVTTIFGGAASLPNVVVSTVPFANYVNLSAANRTSWIQPAYRGGGGGGGGGRRGRGGRGGGGGGAFAGATENRNSDEPRNTYDDLTETPPVGGGSSVATQFRGPLNAFSDTAPTPYIAQLQFAQNSRSAINNSINAMTRATGQTRINVGLLWGRMTLAPSWQGVWDATRPTLPWSLNAQLQRVIVLVSGSANNLFAGNDVAITNDNTETLRQCQAIASTGVELFVVAYGTNANQTLLANCAGDTTHFYVASNASKLNTALQSIADIVLYNTLRLSQ